MHIAAVFVVTRVRVRGSRCNTDILPRNVLYDVRYASHFTFYTHDLVGGANESLPALPVCHSKEHQISLE